jgi:hypothetical protein
LERGGSSVEEGVEQPARVSSGLYLVVMEWMATITGDRGGYPGFSGFGGFFSEEKNFGEPSSAWRKWKTNLFSFVKLILKESALIKVKNVS